MSRNTVQSATIDSVARPARPFWAGTSAPAQVLLDLARPWHVILSQLLLMAEPFLNPDQRDSLQRQVRRLEGSPEPVAGTAGLAGGLPLVQDRPERMPGGGSL